MAESGDTPEELPSFDEGQLADARRQLEDVREEWLFRPEVTAVDVGYKIREEGRVIEGDKLAIRVHVKEKDRDLSESARVPPKIGGFDTDVIEGRYQPQAEPPPAPQMNQPERRQRRETLIGGISVGSGGTLGAIVYDDGGKPCILSNYHVLAWQKDPGQDGDSLRQGSVSVTQPGLADDFDWAANEVASEVTWNLDADMDAAIARIDSRTVATEILGMAPIEAIAAPREGMVVRKSGKTTVVTEGVITGLSLSTKPRFYVGREVQFRDQVHITPRPPWPVQPYELSARGDSGSVWVDMESGAAVALSHMGEILPAEKHEAAIASPMPAVAAVLGIVFH